MGRRAKHRLGKGQSLAPRGEPRELSATTPSIDKSVRDRRVLYFYFRLQSPLGKTRDQTALRADLIITLPGPALGSRPAIVDEVEHDAIDVVEFDFVSGIIAVIRLAHDPAAARLLDPFLRRFHVIDPNPEMMQADEIAA